MKVRIFKRVYLSKNCFNLEIIINFTEYKVHCFFSDSGNNPVNSRNLFNLDLSAKQFRLSINRKLLNH